MTHVKQKQGAGTCGAVAYASILGITELQGIRECGTVMRGRRAGTCSVNVQAAFLARGIETHRVDLGQPLSEAFWLPLLSTHFPLYVAIQDTKRGSSHAIAIADSMVYDGHNDGPVPLELYEAKWVSHLLVVDLELSTYVKTT